jgi:hypothetical protein
MLAGLEGKPTPRRGAILLGAALVYLFTVGWLMHLGYPVDDSFISFRYAQNTAAGHGVVYNIGERVEGYTNFLWVMLLAGVARLGLDLVPWSMGLGLFFAGLTVLSVWRFALRMFEMEAKASWAGRACLLLGTNVCFLSWAYVGMETPLFTFLLTISLLLFVREIAEERRCVWSPLVLAAAALTRPEAAAILVLNVIALSYTRRQAGKPWALHAACFMLLFALIIVPYFIWRFRYYGFLFPNTYYVKVGGWHTSLAARGAMYCLGFCLAYAPWLLGISGVWVVWRRLPFWVKYFGAVALFWSAIVVYEGGDYFGMYRFLVPLIPVLALLTAYGVAQWASRILTNRSGVMAILRDEKVVRIVGILLLWGLPTLHLMLVTNDLRLMRSGSSFAWRCALTGRWLHSIARQGETLAVFGAGAVPYYSKLYTIDMLGLSDLHIAHLPGRLGHSMAGHEKYDSDYVIARRPTFIVFGPRALPKPPSEAEVLGNGHFPFASDLAKNAGLKQHYEFRVGRYEDLYFPYYRLKTP